MHTDENDGIRIVDILVADGFVLTEVAGIVDTLRIANRVCPKKAFDWTYRSLRGGLVASPCRAHVETLPVPKQPDADYLFVVGNADTDSPDLSLREVINRYTFARAGVYLLAEAASRYIQETEEPAAGLTTHWENSALIRERKGVFDAGNVIAARRNAIVTCAGMGTTVDVVLDLLAEHLPQAVQATVADILLHERVRAFDSPQNTNDAERSRTGDSALDLCLDLMRANVEEPIPIGEFGPLLGISNRALERRFRTHFATTPNAYYRGVRLTRANNLLHNTDMTVREVGLACGFTNGFAALYRDTFGVTPTEMRKRRRPHQR